MSAVCVTPGCTCPTSLRQEREAAAERVAAAVVAKRGGGRPLSPCGTIAAYRRHVKKNEPIDGPCESAHKLFEGERAQERSRLAQEEREAEVAARAAAATSAVTVVGGRVLFEVSVADARMIAASVLDRALTLEPNRHVASHGALSQVDQEKVAALRALHKRIAAATRADA